MTHTVEAGFETILACGKSGTLMRLKRTFPMPMKSARMHRPVPFPSLPIRRKRRSRLPAIAAVLFAFATLFIVVSTVRNRQRPAVERGDVPSMASSASTQPPAPARPAPPLKKEEPVKPAAAQKIKPLKAMPSGEVRTEFEKAAAVLRSYFQSPSDNELQTLLRHPADTLPRHRAWTTKRRLVPAIPLQIGPQFGVSGSLLVTSVKLADGSSRLAALEHTPQGYRLDWESFSAWGECHFSDLAAWGVERPALVRVMIRPSSATPPVGASAASFTVSHPDERATLAAYALNNVLDRSPSARGLRNSGGGMFTLRLAVDENDAKSGWARITEVVSIGWVAELSTRE